MTTPKTPEDTPAADPKNISFDPTRRTLLGWTAAAAGTATLGHLATPSQAQAATRLGTGAQLVEEKTLAELQEAMEAGELTSERLVRAYLERIRRLDQRGPKVNSVIEVNPEAISIARALDAERRISGSRGPLHGIPILLKDNIDTGDQMVTAAGSLALVGSAPVQDATVAERLRFAGAVVLGKAGLSEWANFRGFASSSGWSARGGQVNNPYFTDRNPCGSSSGSAASTSASFATAALGTETDGSIVCPSSANGVVGIKPTVGLTSRAGVIPISDTQDTVGPHGRTVADAAAVLGALTGIDPRDPKTDASAGNFFSDYTQFLNPDGLNGARIGVARQLAGFSPEGDVVFEEALSAMEGAGATLVDPANFPSFEEFSADDSEIIVLIFEFKRDLNAYLSTRVGVPITSLADLIDFNLDNADAELAFFGQELLQLAEDEVFSESDYLDALDRGFRLAATEGIDAVLADNNLDAIVAPTNSPAWPTDLVNGDCFLGGSSSYAAVAGYPLVTVPAGFAFGLPLGITFMASAWQEPRLIELGSGFEAVTGFREAPQFLRTLDLGDPTGRPATPSSVGQTESLKRRLLEGRSILRHRIRFL